jgi:hypothetical protein
MAKRHASRSGRLARSAHRECGTMGRPLTADVVLRLLKGDALDAVSGETQMPAQNWKTDAACFSRAGIGVEEADRSARIPSCAACRRSSAK